MGSPPSCHGDFLYNPQAFADSPPLPSIIANGRVRQGRKTSWGNAGPPAWRTSVTPSGFTTSHSGTSGLGRFGRLPPGAEDVDLAEEDILLASILRRRELGLELGHLLLAVLP